MSEGTINKIMLDIINRLLDEQRRISGDITEMKSAISKISEETDEILYSFRNGFRADIKTHVSEEVGVTVETIKELSENFESFNDTYKKNQEDIYRNYLADRKKWDENNRNIQRVASVKFWVKVFAVLITALGTIFGSGAAIMSKFMPITPQSSNVQSPADKPSK